ncbi:MAG: polysaccharide biosynthesis C-terminal domain-containing protein, partial [Bacteroidota bacterium]
LKALGEGVTMFVNAMIMFAGQAGGIWLFASTTTGPFWEALFTQPIGLISYAIATVIAQALVVLHAAHRLHRYIRPRWWAPLGAPLAASLASGAAMWGLLQVVPSIWMMVPAGAVGFGVYGLVLGLIAGERLSKDVGDVLNAVGKNNARVRRLASGAEKVLVGLQIGGTRTPATR